MDFSSPPRRRPSENLLPMINVVFLLLIFFLISAEMTPPEPFPVSPPEAEAKAAAEGEFTLHLSAEGLLGYRDQTGDDAALSALTGDRARFCTGADCVAVPPRLILRADAAVPGVRLAALLPRIGGLGFADLHLVTALP